MAESVVSFLLTKLTTILVEQASLLAGLRHEVEEIKLELESMQSFLKDADRRKDSNEGMKTWVSQVRDVSHDIEDIIDEFMFYMDTPRRLGFFGLIRDAIKVPKNFMLRHRFSSRLQLIKQKVEGIAERRSRYNLDADQANLYDGGERWQRHVGASFTKGDDENVGMTEKENLLVSWLVEEEPQQAVISVVGMGGVGKTTLVAKTYKNQTVKKHFDCYAWVSVSQSYRTEELLRSIVKEFFEAKNEAVPREVASMDARQLVKFVDDYLQSKRYVIVLDDIWSIDAYSDISIAFPLNRCGSRVMLTTRNEDVASALGTESRVYALRPLQETEAWELFCLKAFWKEPCPPELQDLARSIVSKCEGLPLAIVAMGGLLSLKDRNVSEWENAYDSLRWELSNSQFLKRMKGILFLSFNDLPYYLKFCFLYCSIFPEDYLIKRKRLIRLWVAEGFVEKRGRMTVEEVAEVYLKELVQRNMLQVVKRNHFGRIKVCRVHDLIRELALFVSEEEKFFMPYEGQGVRRDGKIRRLSVHTDGKNFSPRTTTSTVRSFFVFDRSISSSSLHQLMARFKLLRVLDLEGIPIESLPDELVELFNLRYLNLKGTKVRELPRAISKLQNLQILDVSDTNMDRLPSGIIKLRSLRHLFLYYLDRQVTESYRNYDLSKSVVVPTKGLSNLMELQSLLCIEANREIIREVGNLTQLKVFGIIKVRQAHGVELCASVEKMRRLLTLGIVTISEEEPLELKTLCPPPNLQKLFLVGHLYQVPHWFRSLRNVIYLYLYWSRFTENALPSLQALPNLVLLQFVNAYDGKELRFSSGWFPKLRKLRLCDMKELNSVVIEEKAMPCIQQLSLFRCRELKMVPQGIEYLTSLEELYLEEMPAELIGRLRRNGTDRLKVQKIPIIEHHYRAQSKWHVERIS